MSRNKSREAYILNPETWVDRYGNYLYRFALARVKDPGIAEDLVQETFLAALRGLLNFKQRSSGHTWLTAILKHKIVDFLRKRISHDPKRVPCCTGHPCRWNHRR